MLRSRAVWAIAIAHICINWSLYLVLSWFPTFVNRELGADLQLAGFLALAPTIVSLIMAPLAGRLFDRLVGRGRDRLKVRRTMQSLAFVGITAAMMAITLTDSLILSVTVITLSNALTAFSIGGFATNHLDIAPNQSGLLMGVTNTLAAVSSSASVFVSGWIQDLSGGWDAVFLTAAGVYRSSARLSMRVLQVWIASSTDPLRLQTLDSPYYYEAAYPQYIIRKNDI